jgi:hypothetical protein
MGGFSSGRRGWRAVIESRIRIDVCDLNRRGQLADCGAGKWRWKDDDGEEIASVLYFVQPEAVTLYYSVNGELCQVRLKLTRIPCRYGGARVYFRCPRCAERVEVIVQAGTRTWGCRRCLRLRYISQGLSVGERCQRRADKLRDRVAIDDGEYLHKRKWLRWRTFNRACDRADNLQQIADGAFSLRIAGWLGLGHTQRELD